MTMKHRFAAYLALINRYRETFSFYWRQRKELSGPQFQQFEAEFMPAALSIQASPVSPIGRWVARILILLILVLLVWAIFGKIDIIVNAQGKIIPSAYTKTIASVEVASVRAIHVKEGQKVHAGDLLLELDASQTDAERDKAFANREQGLLQMARAQALLAAIDKGKSPHLVSVEEASSEKNSAAQAHLDGDYADYLAKLRRIDGEISHYRTALPLATQTERDYFELQKNHDVAMHAYLEKQQVVVDTQAKLLDAMNQRNALIAETRKRAFDMLLEGRKIATDAEKDALRADSRSRLMKLFSPVDGAVQQLSVHTIGGVVAATQPLMQIVPKGNAIEVETVLENKDVGFVKKGQQARIKVDAFEYTKYGTVSGRLEHVSHDAVEDEKKGLLYLGRIILDRSTMDINGQAISLTPGMSVNVEIKTGTRRIIEYVLSPLLQHTHEGLQER